MMLGRANYIALVGGGRQPKFPINKVIIWDDAKQKAVITLDFATQVRGVRLSRNRIVVVLYNSVHVYAFSSPPQKISVSETTDNPLGLCSLSQRLLAFPGRTPGQVQLVETDTGNVRIIPAHNSALRAIQISPDGEIMATASEQVRCPPKSWVRVELTQSKGTLIRVFGTQSGARIAELRRGVDHATIFSMAFSPSSQMLAVTSDKSTLHVFDIEHPTKPRTSGDLNRRFTSAGSGSSSPAVEESSATKWGILSRIPLLPRVFSDVYSFATAHFELVSEEGGNIGNGDHYGLRPQPTKGVIGWTSDSSLCVVSAGRDGRWEKFIIAEGEDGKRHCLREGWKRYLGPS
jgi:WD40 repeat protein